MVDRDESGLHSVQLSLDGRAMLDSDSLVLIDIRDRVRMTKLFAEIKPDVVFHAAALKHLPLLQAHPSEALKSNVWGTLSVLDAAAARRRHPLRQHLHRQGRQRGQRARLLEAGGRGAHLALRPDLPGHLPERPLRQRARQPRLGAHRVPGPARGAATR